MSWGDSGPCQTKFWWRLVATVATPQNHPQHQVWRPPQSLIAQLDFEGARSFLAGSANINELTCRNFPPFHTKYHQLPASYWIVLFAHDKVPKGILESWQGMQAKHERAFIAPDLKLDFWDSAAICAESWADHERHMSTVKNWHDRSALNRLSGLSWHLWVIQLVVESPYGYIYGSYHEWHVVWCNLLNYDTSNWALLISNLGKSSAALHCGLGCHCCADPCALHLVLWGGNCSDSTVVGSF